MDAARRILALAVAEHGPGLAEEPRRLANLLADLCGDERRASFVLTHAARERIPRELAAAIARGGPAVQAAQVARSARRLSEALGFDYEVARWAVESWALALGAELKPPEPIVVCAAGAGRYRTIGEAIRQAAPGARIEVLPGHYAESLTVDRPVEIVARDAGGSVVVVAAAGASCLRLQAERALVRGLTLMGGMGEGSGTLFAVDVPRGDLALEGCEITAGALACVAVRGRSAGATLRRCRIRGGKQAGVYVSLGGGAALEECEVVENGGAGIEIGWEGNPILRRCRVSRNGTYGIRIYAGGGGSVEECDLTGNALGAWYVEE